MKKRLLILPLFLLSIILISGVLADVPVELPAPELPTVAGDYGPWQELAKVTKGAISGLAAIVSYTLGGEGFGDVGFQKFLLFLILTLILFAPAKTIVGENRTGLATWLSIFVSILAIYWLPTEIISGLLLPYSALGITISVTLPLIFLVYFTHKQQNSVVRKVIWIVAAVSFLGLLMFRLADPATSPATSTFMVMGYGAAIIACGVLFWFDGNLHRLFFNIMSEKSKVIAGNAAISELLARRAAQVQNMKIPGYNLNLAKQDIAAIDAQIAAIRDVMKG
jgi:hypothetical protein